MVACLSSAVHSSLGSETWPETFPVAHTDRCFSTPEHSRLHFLFLDVSHTPRTSMAPPTEFAWPPKLGYRSIINRTSSVAKDSYALSCLKHLLLHTSPSDTFSPTSLSCDLPASTQAAFCNSSRALSASDAVSSMPSCVFSPTLGLAPSAPLALMRTLWPRALTIFALERTLSEPQR